MSTGQQIRGRLANRSSTSICRSCRNAILRQNYATAAAIAGAELPNLLPIPPANQSSQSTSYAINAGVVISRPPQITRDLHPFEAAFFLYQRRLNERLALPFSRYFYYKKKTPADGEWKRKIKQRLTPARDIGRYTGYGSEAWNDELLVGAKESEFEHQVGKLVEDAESSGFDAEEEAAPGAKKVEREPVERPMPRITEADEKNDTKSLNRALQRTLYLVVKNKQGGWQFPQDRLQNENLHGAAQRILGQSTFQNMHTWLVGHNPIGHHIASHEAARQTGTLLNELGAKTFFLKARIMAGQIDLKDNSLGLVDFKWLNKEEVQKEVESDYWHSVRNMLAER